MTKKTYITYENGERETLYCGIEEIEGEWLLTTGGDPITKVTCEEADDTDTIDMVDFKIENATWEECDEDDIAYINEWLDIWGLV